MNGIIGMTDILLDTGLSLTQKDYLLTVRRSAGSLLEMINGVLDYSEIEAGKITVDPAPMYLRQNLEELLKNFSRPAYEKNLALRLEIDPAVPDFVFGDAPRLQQIIANLVGNAIKFTASGEVVLKLSRNASAASQIRFAVCDTGIGIAPGQLSKVFEAFAQADGSSTREFGGTGLGLTIASRLVEAMHGKLSLESTLGQGSCFHFSVCLTEPSRPALQLILLAEDNIVNQRVALRMLEKEGHHVIIAQNGKQAVEACRSQSFDLILMDVQMPEMDGIDATAEIRHLETGSQVPIIAFTAHATRERCLAAGMNGYLSKPLNKNDLLKILRELPEHCGIA
jgi:CheY-like chemotaxis protein